MVILFLSIAFAAHACNDSTFYKNCVKNCDDDIRKCKTDCNALFCRLTDFDKNSRSTNLVNTNNEMQAISPSDTYILVMTVRLSNSYLMSGDGATKTPAVIDAPHNFFLQYAYYANVNDKFHIFGGNIDSKKIARLDTCTFTLLPERLNFDAYENEAAMGYDNGTKALICFGMGNHQTSDSYRYCDSFDGEQVTRTFMTTYPHTSVALGSYKGQPTVTGSSRYGSSDGTRKTETMTPSGWINLPDHPNNIINYNAVGLKNGDLIIFGGMDYGKRWDNKEIWRLKDDDWSVIGNINIIEASYSILIDNSVYVFGRYEDDIQRIDFNDQDTIDNIEVIGYHSFPDVAALSQASADFCI